MKNIDFREGVMDIEDGSVIMEVENSSCGRSTVVSFDCVTDPPQAAIKGGTALITVSSMEINHEGEEYLVDLNGPLNITMSSEPFREAGV